MESRLWPAGGSIERARGGLIFAMVPDASPAKAGTPYLPSSRLRAFGLMAGEQVQLEREAARKPGTWRVAISFHSSSLMEATLQATALESVTSARKCQLLRGSRTGT